MHNSARIICVLLLSAPWSLTAANASSDQLLNDVPVSAPIDPSSAGRGGDIAIHSVMRIFCIDHGTFGTGFLHKSGNILTADHVVHDCKTLQLVLSDNTREPATILAEDQVHDLAAITPSVPITASALLIAVQSDFKIGAEVSTWGFPAGYSGLSPLLSVGYLAGVEATRLENGTIIRQWVVNAAFNGGNSGGPLIQIETGEVLGVVSSKLAPISPEAASILQALEKNAGTGVMYNGKTADGKDIHATEGQLVGKVLAELRNQVQLVIGKAVTLDDLKAFLATNKIDP